MQPVRSSRSLHRLSVAAIKYIKTPGWHSDGGGLYLEVDPGGGKRWALRLTINGRRRDFGIGPLHKVSLQQARETAVRYRSLAYQGLDPIAEKQRSRKRKFAPTFEQAARQIHDERRASWSSGKHIDQWLNTLRDYAFPLIGSIPVNDIGTPQVLKVLTPIWNEKPETARRVRQRIALVFDWARAAGHRSGDNPVSLIGDALPRHKKKDDHHAALPYERVREFIALLRTGRAGPVITLAFEFLILTATRSTDVRGARWHEINFEENTWTIPGDDGRGRRMKTGRTHVVPLSARCVEILVATKDITPKTEFVFPDTVTGRAMAQNRFLNARDALGYTRDVCTPHGFRSSFRDWAAEETAFPAEVAEMALAHSIRNKIEAAYRRGNLLVKRRELMEAWATYATTTSAP